MQSYLAGKQFAKTVLVAGLLAFAVHSKAADWSLPVTGNLLGTVLDGAGDPQMGASIELLNKYDRLVSKTMSGTDGRFAFAGLASDIYSVRVSLNSFLPAFRDRILIRAGANSMLQIHLSTLFSNIQLGSTVPSGGMTTDWKWVLRSSPSTRPITRFLPDDSTLAGLHRPQVFSGTRMMVGISGGASGLVDSESSAGDLGTRFALSTNLYGKNQIQVAGGLGQGFDAGGTAFGLSAIYTRTAAFAFASAPEITLTVSQISLLGSPGMPSTTMNQGGNPAGILRTMSLSVYETADPIDGLHLEYGTTGESVDYLQHTSRISPFARASVSVGPLGTLIAAYSDGGRPDELAAHQVAGELEAQPLPNDDLASAVNAMARMPQISTRGGRQQLQRTKNVELGFDKVVGSRTYAFSAFSEQVSNGRVNISGDFSSLPAGNILSDGISQTSTLNIGNYNRQGYMASVTQKLNDFLGVQAGYGRMGGFTAASASNFLREANHNLASLALNAHVAKTGTRLSAEYGFADSRALIPQHLFTTQTSYAAPGLNFYFRQPLPSLFGLPGRLELTGDLRNLLSNGYLPLLNGDGRKLLLVQAPKSVRGGVSFTF